MSKKAAVQPAKDKVKATEVATPVAEKSAPATIQTTAPEPMKQVATAAAVKKVAAKPKVEKKVVAEKPAPAAAKEKVAEAPKAEKAAKVKKQAPKKPKLIRDSFTIPEADYALFATLKQRALSAGVEVKKGEILRAALVALAKLDDAELVKAIGLVERIKTGRPKK